MLTRNQRFTLNGEPWRVLYVTPSRAHCLSLATRTVTLRNGRTFRVQTKRTLDISPDAQIDLLNALLAEGTRA